MSIPKRTSSQNFVKVIIAGGILTGVTLLVIMKTPVARSAGIPAASNAETFTVVIPNYAALSPDQMNQATDDFEELRLKMIRNLEEQLKNPNLTDHAKAEIIRMFGKLQAVGETNYLIKNINFEDPILPPRLRTVWRTPYPARQTLESFGGYGTKAILAVIGNRNRAVPFDPAQIEGFLDVLAVNEQPRYAMLMLADARDAPVNKLVRANYQEMLARLKQRWPYVGNQARGTGPGQSAGL